MRHHLWLLALLSLAACTKGFQASDSVSLSSSSSSLSSGGSSSPSPSTSPTASPTVSPTANPTVSPTTSPTVSPTASPTVSPTSSPTNPVTPPVTPPAGSSADICSVAVMQANAQVTCPAGQVIVSIPFAGFGEAAANSCGSYAAGLCNSGEATYLAQTNCLGKSSCSLSPNLFGDPCDAFYKVLTLDARCGAASSVTTASKPVAPTLSTSVSNPPSGQICAVAADNSTANLSCPSGQVISKIVFASYGTPGGSCGNYTQGFCHSGNTLDHVEQACLGNQTCSISTGFWPFNGDPCPDYTKQFAVQAVCANQKTSTGTDTHVCGVAKEGTNSTITCPTGQTVSKIAFAIYGDPANGTCGNYTMSSTTCTSGLAMKIAQDACLGKASCSVGGNEGNMGDPCDSMIKSMTVDAVCSNPGTAQQASVNLVAPTISTDVSSAPAGDVCSVDPSQASLSCPTGQVISRIVFASYGTPGGKCGAYTQGFCHSGNSVSTVEASCLGQQSCSVGANYNVFWGDPCSGYGKVLAVEAKCAAK